MTLKKTFLSLLALITMGGSAMADDKPVITVADVEALPGETVSFYVNLSDGKDNTYKGMALYVYSTQDGFSLTGVTAASEWAGASGITGSINPSEGFASVTVTSGNALPSGTIDNLLTVSLTVDNSVALGEYDITLKKTALRYFDAQDNPCEDIADDVTFTVKVVNAHTVTLNEASTVAPANANGVNVKVIRTINAKEWSTICLPFAMSEAQVKAAFGDDVKLGDFNDYETTEDAGDIVGITVKFNTATAIEANHPYIIRVSSAINEFTAEGVNIAVEDEPMINFGSKKKPRAMVGTYVNGAVEMENALFLSGGKFWYFTGNKTMKGFRAYFDFIDVVTAYESAPVFMSFDNGTTGIKLVQAEGDNSYYDLNGRKVLNPKKGIYIHNGKKEVVK